jgi:hypothetical protein
VKRSGRDEPMWITKHMCMDAKLGISVYSYLYLKLAKILCLSFMSYASSSTKLENKRVEQILPGSRHGGRRWPKQCMHM